MVRTFDSFPSSQAYWDYYGKSFRQRGSCQFVYEVVSRIEGPTVGRQTRQAGLLVSQQLTESVKLQV